MPRTASRSIARLGLCALTLVALPAGAQPPATPVAGTLHDPREVHLAEVRQLTFGGENAEAYWSFDGKQLSFQRTAPGLEAARACDQIYRMDAMVGAGPEGAGLTRVSTGTGRTTCAYFYPAGDRLIFASTHAASPDCPPVPDRSQGYVWPIYDTYELYTARPDGSDLVRLTDNQAYDAEATVCGRDGSVLFTSTRDGDLELYRMDADGQNVKRLTSAPGYDGGAFFSEDCTRIVWRASRPQGGELEDYQRLLAQGLVRPGKLELWVADADGTNAHQVTSLGTGTFAPFFVPDAARAAGVPKLPRRILFSSNTGDPRGREFDIWAINEDGSGLERITYTPGFDGFPMFSPDGQWLAFGSNRNQGKPGETDVYVARWVAGTEGRSGEVTAADRFAADVAWLAADEREGRGVGTAGLEAAGGWIEERFRALGLEPGGLDGGYRQRFMVPVSVARLEETSLALDGAPVAPEAYVPAAFSAGIVAGDQPPRPATASGELVFVGYGITAPEAGIDDYAGKDVTGKVVLVRRFVPTLESPPEDFERRFSELRYKAFNAREHGAAGVVVVDLPESKEGEELPAEAPLPSLRVDRAAAGGDAGLPVVVVRREVVAPLFAADGSFVGGRRVDLAVALRQESQPAWNVIGKIPAGRAEKLPGAVLVGAHYDHLGFGGPGSLAPESNDPHNGADDNASGTAAILEAARTLAERRGELARDIWVVAFSGEESGLLGSTAFTRNPTGGLALESLVAMLNLDMVGRVRQNQLTVLGVDSATAWRGMVEPACAAVGFVCAQSGDGYGPSDQTPFYAAGIPVLHFFSGAHNEYHKPSDDPGLVNANGGARVAALTAEVAATVANRAEPLGYQNVPPPAPQGDLRSYGASLGTIPDYAGAADGRPGVLLAGTRPGSAADKAGILRGDLLVELAGHPIRDIHDFMFVLRGAKPGQQASVVVERGGERITLQVIFGEAQRMR
jgi:Tol biopolymer transport system component